MHIAIVFCVTFPLISAPFVDMVSSLPALRGVKYVDMEPTHKCHLSIVVKVDFKVVAKVGLSACLSTYNKVSFLIHIPSAKFS